MIDKQVIGITAFKNVESPQPGFGVARALKDNGHTIIGIDDTPINSAMFAPYVDTLYLCKSLGEENIEEFVKDLEKIKQETGMSILIPSFDREVYFINKHREKIERLGINLLIPQTQALKLASKPFLSKLDDEDIKTPPTIRIKNEQDVDEACKELGFPVVCKGIIKDAYIAKNESEARQFFQKIREIWHGGKGSILMQKFIFGETITVAGVSDNNFDLKSQVMIKKLGIDSKGTTWSGVTVQNERVGILAKKIVTKLGWVGPFELEFIKDIKTGDYYLFEINPRLPSWIYLGNMAGCNVPQKIIDILQGKKRLSSDKSKEGIVFSRFSEEVFYTQDELNEFRSKKKITPLFGEGGKKNDRR